MGAAWAIRSDCVVVLVDAVVVVLSRSAEVEVVRVGVDDLPVTPSRMRRLALVMSSSFILLFFNAVVKSTFPLPIIANNSTTQSMH